MDLRVQANNEVSDHIRLLRSAARGKLALLSLCVLVTAGLWATLQSGDNRALAIFTKYDAAVKALKEKWNIPDTSSVARFTDLRDQITVLTGDKSDLPSNTAKMLEFHSDLQSIQQAYYVDRRDSYVVAFKVPYLQEPISINGLTLADWWPFGIVALIAGALVFGLRERVNAIILSWFALRSSDASTGRGIIIRSDFRVGTLAKSASDSPAFVYHRPLTVQPESLLIYALVVATIYLSFSFEMLYNPATSHEMMSTLLDYAASIWFFSTFVVIILGRTRKKYSRTLEQFVGHPVRGQISEQVHKFVSRCKHMARRLVSARSWSKLKFVWAALLPLAALLCLALPWMDPNGVSGFRFLLSSPINPLGDELFTELRIQLTLAVLFVVLCLFSGIVRRRAPLGRLAPWLIKATRILGGTTLVLGGNLVFHFVLLDIAADEIGLFSTIKTSSRSWPIQRSSLIWTDPSDGFWLFLLLCIFLYIDAKPRSS
jgi:hypothetical protein